MLALLPNPRWSLEPAMRSLERMLTQVCVLPLHYLKLVDTVIKLPLHAPLISSTMTFQGIRRLAPRHVGMCGLQTMISTANSFRHRLLRHVITRPVINTLRRRRAVDTVDRRGRVLMRLRPELQLGKQVVDRAPPGIYGLSSMGKQRRLESALSASASII